MSINQLTISGRLTRDPEIRPVGDSTLVEFGLASNRSFPKRGTGGDTGVPVEWEERPTFLDVKVWKRNLTDRVSDLTKGTEVVVIGRLDYESWESQAGEKRSKLVCTVTDKGHEVQPMGRFGQVEGGGAPSAATAGRASGGVAVTAPAEDLPWS